MWALAGQVAQVRQLVQRSPSFLHWLARTKDVDLGEERPDLAAIEDRVAKRIDVEEHGEVGRCIVVGEQPVVDERLSDGTDDVFAPLGANDHGDAHARHHSARSAAFGRQAHALAPRGACDAASMDPADLVAPALDPMLEAYGFAAAQGGQVDAEQHELLWCAALVDLRERCSWLPQVREQSDGPDHACVDLQIRVRAGRLLSVDLEARSLGDTLRSIDMTAEADAADRLDGAPIDVALPVLVGLVEAMLGPRDR